MEEMESRGELRMQEQSPLLEDLTAIKLLMAREAKSMKFAGQIGCVFGLRFVFEFMIPIVVGGTSVYVVLSECIRF